MNDYDRIHIQEIIENRGERWSWFACHLLRLIGKADDQNRARLRSAFPDEVAAYEDWFHGRKRAAVEEVADAS